jgi:serine protease Do
LGKAKKKEIQMKSNNYWVLALTLLLFSGESLLGQEKKTRPEPPGPDVAEPMAAKDKGGNASQKESTERKTGNWYIRQSPQLLKAFEPVTQSSKGSTVKILANVKTRSKETEDQVSFGTVVDAAGFIITKASQIRAKAKTLKVEINGKKVPAKVFGIHEESDLAMLKVEPAGLEIKPIVWQSQTPQVGYFLATPDSESKTIGFGVLSVASREERDSRGYMGVLLGPPSNKEMRKGSEITSVTPKSPAQYAGLKKGDVIYHVDGTQVEDTQDLIKKVQKHKAGEVVKVKIKRAGQDIELSIKLANRRVLGIDRLNPQETIAGNKLSSRRTGFERVIQHDTVLKPEQMGGPILDLNGQAIGVNIAKNGRVSTYALPISVIESAVAALKSGKLNPATVHKPRIDQLAKLIADKEKELADSNLKKTVEEAEKKLEAAKSAYDEAAEAYEKLQKELEAAGKKKYMADNEHKKQHLDNRKQKRNLKTAEEEIEKLKQEKKDLEDTFK